jgi:7-cyano-7-deazaguanine reductase
MKYLGKTAGEIPDWIAPEDFELECVPNPERENYYVARFTLPEFTSLCPVTGQPDFASIIIDYIPRDLLVESKALKLYATSFRNVGEFHEKCSNAIADKIVQAADPWHLRICAFWYPRGGIPIDVFIERSGIPRSDKPDAAMAYFNMRAMLPPMPQRDYRGR